MSQDKPKETTKDKDIRAAKEPVRQPGSPEMAKQAVGNRWNSRPIHVC